jgi:7,8-dihydroneopterin aldolase/epimerase/oxygenase
VIEGTVEIRGLRCRGRQGTTETERAKEQTYLVDVGIVADLERAIESDDLRDAIDISAIAATVRGSVAERPRALVERIAADVASTLLMQFASIRQVRVKVTKPHPDGLDAESEAIEITRAR